MNNPIVIFSFLVQVYTISCTSENEWTVITDENGNFEIVDADADSEDSDCTLAELQENIIFYLFTPSNPTDGQRIYIEEMLSDTRLNDTNFNASYPTRICIHGWGGSVKSSSNTLIRDAYLEVGSYNIIVVDWRKYAQYGYIYARSNIASVGKYVGLLIDSLEINGVNPKDLIVIGHSLGAHLAGIACRSSQYDVGILIALDPAGPLFYLIDLNARLRSTDALFVQVCHTSAGTLGHLWNLGTVDIWVNDGLLQPGCGLDLFHSCGHARAHIYFAESIKYHETIYFTRYSQSQSENCTSQKSSHLGGIDIDTTACGIHNVDTNSNSLYARGYE